ncbi:MAG TPA: nucleotide exchange factor GrpE [Acidobacteriota bacterium]|nr:nucleotide exchange factor GrpE [Acidobacteriota bacterium]
MKQQKDTQEPAAFQVIDKRHFLDLDNLDKSTVEEKPRYPSYVEELMGRVAETERRFDEKKKQIDQEIARTKARLEADYSRRIELEKQKLVLPLLDVLDNLERALDAVAKSGSVDHLREGVEMTANLFRARLQELRVEWVPLVGSPFDPNLSQAVGIVKVEEDDRDGVVMEEVLRGYRMGDQLLRAAQVRVGKKS